MSNKEKTAEQLSDRDADFDGTYPGSKSVDHLLQDRAGTASIPVQREAPYTTTRQYRNYLEPINRQDMVGTLPPATDQDRLVARQVASSIRSARQQLTGVQYGTLLDLSGRAVVGSKAFSPDQLEQYKTDHPGSYIYGIDEKPTGSPVDK